MVDEKDCVIGMISLSDLLSFLALKPVNMDRNCDISDSLFEESENSMLDSGDINKRSWKANE